MEGNLFTPTYTTFLLKKLALILLLAFHRGQKLSLECFSLLLKKFYGIG